MRRTLLCLYIVALVLNPQKNSAQPITLVQKNENSACYFYIDSKNAITSNVPLNELSAKAYRHFEKNYSAIDKETWTKIPDGVVVTFINNSAFCKIFYNTKGDFVYSYKYYVEKNCNKELIKMIQNAYPQYKIVSVLELYDGNRLMYGINITNDQVTKTIEMKNGELKVLNEFQSQ